MFMAHIDKAQKLIWFLNIDNSSQLALEKLFLSQTSSNDQNAVSVGFATLQELCESVQSLLEQNISIYQQK